MLSGCYGLQEYALSYYDAQAADQIVLNEVRVLYEDAKGFLDLLATVGTTGRVPFDKQAFADKRLAERLQENENLSAETKEMLKCFYRGFLNLGWLMGVSTNGYGNYCFSKAVENLENAVAVYEDMAE